MDLRTDIINNVMLEMQAMLTEHQKEVLQNVLYIQLNSFEVLERSTEVAIIDNTPDALLSRFIATKRVEGKAESTLKRYWEVNYCMIHTFCRPLHELTTFDLRYYLAVYKDKRRVSNRTLDGIRRCLSSFFTWLNAEGLIGRNPCASLTQIKSAKLVKKPYSAVELEQIRIACGNIRDRALVEFLYSSGCRVSEVCALNRTDINFATKEVIVLGKGNKERTIYLTEVAAMHLQMYLHSRKDKNTALFVGNRCPHRRMGKTSIEAAIKRIGSAAKVENTHPHRFRRTLATNLIDRGMNIQDVAAILGHEDLKTTQIYCYTSQKNVKAAYSKYAA